MTKTSPVALGRVLETHFQELNTFLPPVVEHLVEDGVRHATPTSCVLVDHLVILTFVDVLLLTMHLDDGLQVLARSVRHML